MGHKEVELPTHEVVVDVTPTPSSVEGENGAKDEVVSLPRKIWNGIKVIELHHDSHIHD